MPWNPKWRIYSQDGQLVETITNEKSKIYLPAGSPKKIAILSEEDQEISPSAVKQLFKEETAGFWSSITPKHPILKTCANHLLDWEPSPLNICPTMHTETHYAVQISKYGEPSDVVWAAQKRNVKTGDGATGFQFFDISKKEASRFQLRYCAYARVAPNSSNMAPVVVSFVMSPYKTSQSSQEKTLIAKALKNWSPTCPWYKFRRWWSRRKALKQLENAVGDDKVWPNVSEKLLDHFVIIDETELRGN